ncbi:hypothetical protein AXG93_3257s1020 [Marchantia polymorpha subsp. ruderalis]|uniref:Uncharacterized protein n=1 Tax=Marchantia polymorpha subsp. ruderalis TaxID=1480154 RepID=A0A176W3Y0_MARPO|nr:hypothetical protein AXG93_3257s1020 [Marchantia polymorpha subsp. ruderalis]
MTSWQVGFVELALAGTPIHSARILWKATWQHVGEEKGGLINHLSPFLINFYRSMGCLTAEERIQFPLLSRANPGRFVRDVEVDRDSDEVPASAPPAQLRAKEEPRGARAPRKRKWDGDVKLNRRKLLTVPVKRRANIESALPKQKARKLILPAGNSADTERAATGRNLPASEEDVSTEVLGRSIDLPAPKAQMPSEEARAFGIGAFDARAVKGGVFGTCAFGSRAFGADAFGAETPGKLLRAKAGMRRHVCLRLKRLWWC